MHRTARRHMRKDMLVPVAALNDALQEAFHEYRHGMYGDTRQSFRAYLAQEVDILMQEYLQVADPTAETR